MAFREGKGEGVMRSDGAGGGAGTDGMMLMVWVRCWRVRALAAAADPATACCLLFFFVPCVVKSRAPETCFACAFLTPLRLHIHLLLLFYY